MAEFFTNLLTDYYFWGGLGFFLGCFISVPNQTKNGASFPVAVVLVVAGIYGGLFGARFLHVLIVAPRLVLARPLMALAFWHGGLAWQGGIVLGAMAVLLVAKILRQSAWESLGCIAPGYALAHGITRIGCLMRGCCFGRPTTVPWAIYSKELCTRVHPTQVYSMIGEFLSFLILQYFWRKKEYRKYLFPGYGMLFGFHRFVAEFYRGVPPGPELISGLRIYQVVCILIFSTSLLAFLILRDKKSGLKYSAVIVLITAATFFLFKPATREIPEITPKGANLYLVATRPMFSEALSKWKQVREEKGFHVMIKSWEASPSTENIKQWIGEQSQAAGMCSHILLVGDCAAKTEEPAPFHIPSFSIDFNLKGKTKTHISDLPYGDLDEDGMPDVPVGRLPVRNPANLSSVLGKILRFESRPVGRNWFRAVVWSGARGYNQQMYHITTELAAKGLPRWLDSFIISGNVDSAFSAWPPDQPKIFLEEITVPAFMSLIVSHGSFRSMTPTIFEEKEIFLSNEHVESMESGVPLGPLVMLGCNSGEFNISEEKDRSLAEAFLRHPGGPSSVVAASGPTNPLTNYFFATAMLGQLEERHQTIGDFFLSVQRRMYKTKDRTLAELAYEDPYARNILGAVPEREKPHLVVPGLARLESMIYHLFGDPAVSLKQPQLMEVSVIEGESGALVASGKTPEVGAQLYADILRPERKKDQLRPYLAREEREERFRKFNRPPELLVQKKIAGDSWEITLKPPEDFNPEKDHIRFLILGNHTLYYDVYPENPPLY